MNIKAQMVLLGAIIFVLMSIIGIWGLQSIRGTKGAIDKVLVIRPFRQLEDTFDKKIENSLYQTLVEEITFEEAEQNLEEAEGVIDRLWRKYSASSVQMPHEEELAALIAGMQNASKKLKVALRQKDKEGVKEFINRDFPASYEPLLAAANRIIDEELDAIDRNLEETSAMYIFELALFILAAMAVMIYCTWKVLQRIGTSLGSVSSQLKEFASGEADLTKRIKTIKQKEVAEVSESFNSFMSKLGSLINKVKKSGTRVKETVKSVATTSLQLENTIKEFDESFSNVSEIASEISETTNLLSKTIEDVSNVASKTSTLAASSKEGLRRMEQTIANIEKVTFQLASMLNGISEKAEKITAVITSISKIASKTNILSLNAAIQSEKAGEYGKSFGVIAREIRELANTVENDSKNIKLTITEMKEAVKTAVVQMDQAFKEVKEDARFAHEVNSQLTNIIDEVQGLSPRFDTVNAGVRTQVEGAAKVKEAVEHFTLGIRETVTSFRHINSAVKKLDRDTYDLQQAVAGFKVEE